MGFDIQHKDQLIDKLVESIDVKEEKLIWDSLWQEAWDELSKTMSDEHIKFLESEFNKVDEARKIGEKYYPNQLFYTIAEMVTFHYQMHEQGKDSSHLGPLEMPPEIAEAWMQQEFMAPSFQCPECKFNWLPCSEKSYESYFKICPICGENLEK